MAVRIVLGRQNTSRGLSPEDKGYLNSVNRSMKEIRDNLKRVIKSINAQSTEALAYALRPTFNTSQRLVPKDTLVLMRSGFLEVRKGINGANAAIGYGRGGRPFYAPIVHERTDLRHKNGTQAKYLQEAIQRHIRQVPARYATYIRNNVGLN